MQLYFVKKRAARYGEAVKRPLPFDLPFRTARQNHDDWVIARVFARASARMQQAEVETGYNPQKAGPPPARAITTKEFVLMVIVEVISWCLPLRVLSNTTADGQLQQSSFGVSIVVDFVRSFFWVLMSARLAGGVSGAFNLNVKFDALQARAMLFTISYFGLILPSGEGASPLAVVSCFIFNITLCGYTRILHRQVVWSSGQLAVYQFQRLIAPVLWTAVGAAYTVDHYTDQSAANVGRNLSLIYFLIGLAFWYELTTKVYQMEVGRPETARVKLAPTSDELETLSKRYGSDAVEAGLGVVNSTGRVNSSGGTPPRSPVNAASPAPGQTGNSPPASPQMLALTPVASTTPLIATPSAGSGGKSGNASTAVGAVAGPPLPQPEERPKLYPTQISGIEFWISVLVELLSSTAPVAKVVDDHSRGDTGSTYQTSLAVTTVLVWARILWWLFVGIRMLGARHFFSSRAVFALDSITARTFAVEITYTAYLASIRTDGTTAVAAISDWVFGFVFAGYIRTVFGFYKFSGGESVLAFYKLQRLYAPILYLAMV